jgi:gluconate 2-dehydrogenase gamma chain
MKISKLQFTRSRAAGVAPVADDTQAQPGVSRRDVLAALLAGTAMASVWSSASAAAVLKKAGAGAATNPGLNKAEMAVLETAAQVIIPATDTPGAREAGVPLLIDAMVARWMTLDEAALFRSGLAGLDAKARERFQRGYAACTAEQGAQLMQELRASSPYGGRTFSLNDRILDPKAPFYLRLRDLVVLGYFMSEQGSTKELRYLPVPGKFEANLDMKTWPYQTVI